MLQGVRINVYSMDTPYSHLDVLQVGLRMENDLSDFVASYSTNHEISDRTFLAPLGKASQNTATVTLSNIDGRFNNYNEDSLYFGLIDKKVRFTIDLGIDATPQSGTKYEYIREFTGWANTWGGGEQTTVDVELIDSSVFLQEKTVPRVFFEDTTVGAIIWQMMDRIGMTNYVYSRSELDLGQTIPFYWPKDIATTVWDEFASLCEATQTALYFDEWDVLRIKCRKAMYADKAVDWNFDATANGQKLPDIISMEVSHDMDANRVDVTYHPAAYSDFQNGLPKMETAWEPEEDTLILRATALSRDLRTTGTDLWIPQTDAAIWPWASLINIRGEVLHYKGKEYAYYKANKVIDAGTGATISTAPTVTLAFVNNLDEQKALDAQTDPGYVWKNYYTGRLAVDQRGLFGSDVSDHFIKGATYTSLITSYDNATFWPWNGDPGARQLDGYVQLFNAVSDISSYNLRKHETMVPDTRTVMYGTKIRFPNNQPQVQVKNGEVGEMQFPTQWDVGGIYFAGDWGDAGYFLEIIPTQHVEDIESRKTNHELSLVVMPGDRPAWRAPGWNANDDDYTDDAGNGVKYGNKGYKVGILYNNWYTVDVQWNRLVNGDVVIAAYLDGVIRGQWTIPVAQAPNSPDQMRFGHFVRGQCNVDYEYLYAVAQDTDAGDPDQSTFLDLVSGGFTSGYIQRQWRFDYRNINPGYTHWWGATDWFPQMVNRSSYAFDEFGPVVHEVREFTVNFADEHIPCAHSFLYYSNTGQIACLSYEADAFGATFMLANASRQTAVLKGTDDWTFGPDNSVEHSVFVYGRCVYQDNDKTLTQKDDKNIRIRGEVKTDFDSTFIQTEDMANALSDWILDLWAGGVDEVSLEVYGNPFIQLGDLVTISFPIKEMLPHTHKYFIVEVKNEFDAGYKSSVVLRRARV
jgi:hypothetical protein